MSIQETITKEKLVSHSKNEFLKAGYSLWNENIKTNVFDFIVKKKSLTNLKSEPQQIIIKVLVDLDLFKKQTSIELHLISQLISAFPLLVAHSAEGKSIERATLYRRHNVSAISLKTLQMFLQYEKGIQSARISKFAQRGGIYVNLSQERFRLRRERLQLNMTILAEKVGISRHSLYKYEKGESFPRIETFSNLSKILGSDLDIPLDILQIPVENVSQRTFQDYKQPRSKLQKEITNYLADKEFNVLWFKSEPFDGLSEPKTNVASSKNVDAPYPMLTGVTSSNDEDDSKKILLISSLSRFLKKKAIWFMEDEEIENIDSPTELPVIRISDLEGMALIDFENILNKKKNLNVVKGQKSD